MDTAAGGQIQIASDMQNRHFAGALDDVRIYDRALSDVEVATLAGLDPGVVAAAAEAAIKGLERGLLGHWAFDEAEGAVVRDSSGRGNHGAVNGGANLAKGKLGGALAFDGRDDSVRVPGLALGEQGTWSLWLKSNAAVQGKGSMLIGMHEAQHSTSGLHVILRPPGLVFAQPKDRSSGACGVTTAVSIADGRWHNIVVTYHQGKGQFVRLYVDGREVSAGRNSREWSFAPNDIRIGESSDSYWQRCSGLIDDVRIYDRVLSAAEVAALCREPERLAAKEAEDRAEAQEAEHVARLTESILGAFDAAIAQGDLAAAKAFALAESKKPENAPVASVIEAAAGVAGELEERAKAIRRSARAHMGANVEFTTPKGKVAGKVARVTDSGIVLKIMKKMRTGAAFETQMTVKWSALSAEDEDGLAGGWKPAGADGHIARAAIALKRKDAVAAEEALDSAGDHPLVPHYRARLAKLTKARERPPLKPKSDPRTKRAWPPSTGVVQRLFRGKVAGWNPKTLAVELLYDFQDLGQLGDWRLSDRTASNTAPTGSLSIVGGRLCLRKVNRNAFLRGRFVSVSVEAHVAITSASLVGLTVCDDGMRNSYCLVGMYGSRAYLEKLYLGKHATLGAAGASSLAKAKHGSMALAFSNGRLKGRVGDVEFEAADTSYVSGKVALRAPGGDVSFDNIRVIGQLDRTWLEVALGLRDPPGLLGTYFKGKNLGEAVLRRIDPQVDFHWGGPPRRSTCLRTRSPSGGRASSSRRGRDGTPSPSGPTTAPVCGWQARRYWRTGPRVPSPQRGGAS
jgi:hypothetical protein